MSLYNISRYSSSVSFLFSSRVMVILCSHSYSSYSLRNCFNHRCSNACSAVGRFSGLNCSNFPNKSRASRLAIGNNSYSGLASVSGKDSSIVVASEDLIDSISFLQGMPVISRIRSSWFRVEVPGNIGLPYSSSAKMQPSDHISTPLV